MSPPRAYAWEDIERVLSFPDDVTIEECYKAIFGARTTAASDPGLVCATLRKVLEHDSIAVRTIKDAGGPQTQSTTSSRSETRTFGPALRNSVLLRHECCYLLGQLGAECDSLEVKKAVFEALLAVLVDADREDEVTQHEAAEGIAAVFNHNIREEDEAEIAAFFEVCRERVGLSASEIGRPAESDVIVEESSEIGRPAESDVIVEEFPADEKTVLSSKDHDAESSPDSARSTDVSTPHSTTSSNDPNAPLTPADSAKDHSTNDPLPLGGSQRLTFLERNATLIALLDRFVDHSTPLGQTCLLAVEGLKRERARVCACQYKSYDPAIGDPSATLGDAPKYSAELENEGLPLYQRYVAMFTLRNLGCMAELGRGLSKDSASAVLRHEIAFVLGQMAGAAFEPEFECEEQELAHQKRCPAVMALVENLADEKDHAMVRHESAIALGSVGGPLAKIWLRKFVSDPEPMVAESCLVGLDMIAYWAAWEAEEKRIMALSDAEDGVCRGGQNNNPKSSSAGERSRSTCAAATGSCQR